MSERMDIFHLEPGGYKAMAGLERYLAQSPIPGPLLHLVKLRASHINGCSYCVDMHSREARDSGETDARLWQVVAWQEAPCFTEEERAALALTEAATLLPNGGDRVPDEIWATAAKYFDEHTLAALVYAIATINAWNRICVATHQIPESFK